VDSTANNAALIPIAGDRFKYRGSGRMLMVVSPARRIGMANSDGAPMLRLGVPNARAVDFVAMPRPRPDPAALAAYAGEYRSPELDASFRLAVRTDTLRLLRGWQPPIPLRPLYQDGFVAGDAGIIRFLRDGRNRVTGFVLWAGRVRHLRFERAQP
jgi:hypothetical protein